MTRLSVRIRGRSRRVRVRMLAALEKTARFGRDPFALLIVFLAGLGTANILVRPAIYGTLGSPDTMTFLSTALNLLAGEGLRDVTGRPLTGWPPLLPLLIAAFGWVGLDPLIAGRWVNAAAFGLTILAAGCWLRSHLRSQWLTLAATAIIAASLPLSDWAPYIKTEPLFVLFTLLALMQLAAFLNRKTDSPLWWAAVFTALAAITRYPGVALIGTGVLVLLPLARLRQTLVFGAVSSVPLLAVLVRNWAVTGHLTRATGYRAPVGQSLSDGLSQAIESFRAWVVPPNAPDGLAYLLGLAVATVGLASTAVILRAARSRSDNGRKDPEAAPAYLRLGPVLPFGAFALLYLVFLIVVVPFTVRQGVDSRYLLPIYVPLLLTAVFLLDRFLSIAAAGWLAAVRYGLVSLVGLAILAHIGYSGRENLRRTSRTTQAYFTGYGDNTVRWRHFETLHYIRDNPIEGRIYSNRAAFAWFWDRIAALGKSRKYQKIADEMRWAEIEAGAHIVWFDRFYNRAHLGYDDLDFRLLPGIEVVAELADGVVFRRTAYEPFDEARHLARKQRYVNQLIQQASEQVSRAGWNVYRTGRKLIYRKEPCVPADTQAKFVLHVVPADLAVLSAYRQRFGSENLDFHFDWGNRKRHGFRLGDQCIAIVHLPAYAIDRIHIGQWIAEEKRTLWKVDLEMHLARKERYVEQLIQQASERVVRAGWTVYRTGRKLIYRKKPCVPADVQAKFVLHVIPVDPADLPAHRQRYGSENLDFYFDWDFYPDWDARRKSPSFRLGDQCIAIAHLPAYPINRIRIGQWISAEDRTLWKAEFAPSR